MGVAQKAKKVWPPKTTTGRLKTKKSMQRFGGEPRLPFMLSDVQKTSPHDNTDPVAARLAGGSGVSGDP
jgi:hypothetical protein